MNGGRLTIASCSARRLVPIARVVLARWLTRPARSDWRAARSVTSLPFSPMNRFSVAGSLLRTWNRRADEARAGLR
jgi:hypothetical protein